MSELQTVVCPSTEPLVLHRGPPPRSRGDALFTTCVNAWQSSVFAWGARAQNAWHRRNEPMTPREAYRVFARGELSARFRELGLDGERFFWGTKTISHRVAMALIRMIDADPPARVLEVGAGTSTAILAALAARHGFSVLSLENHMPTIRYVRELLEGVPVPDRFSLQLCNFTRFDYPDERDGRYWWYNADFSQGPEDFDFVLIDGPVDSVVGRRGSLPAVAGRLAEDHLVLCDDMMRRSVGRECIEAWSRYFPGMTCEQDAYAPRLARIRMPR